MVLRSLTVSAFVFTAAPLAAQTVLSGDHSVDGNLCVGVDCTGSETFGIEDLKIKDDNPRLLFEDTTSSGTFIDWMLVANDSPTTGFNYFAITDSNAGNQIFKIEAGGPANGLYLDNAGELGLGTSLPQREIHMKGGDAQTIRFEKDSTGIGSPQTWDILTDDIGFSVIDQTNGGLEPFRIEPGTATNFSLFIKSTGKIGLGTDTPSAAMHLTRSNGTAQFLVQETSATTSPRTLVNLQNNGRPEIVMGNTDTGGEWSFGAGTNFILKQGAVGTASSAKTKYLTLFAGSGDLEIAGQIITGGPTCSTGCDAGFSADYDLPSITEHAEAMFSLGYLPNVGPTAPGAPINITERYGALLNELEHAHLYIAQLERDNRAQANRIAAQESGLAALARRLDALEAGAQN
ncbi:hypothetical protein [Marimonas arenosa]|uniref:Uncharacterized protein n=1 Tax=Marimonas arenosa TaxID=1795305 RepID=A0AAE3WCM7_9RHOB|nr:hypothetical protein [Marimonas arenosa]MDQ2090264.1 hypothetical protein [Marimonas arenosa]